MLSRNTVKHWIPNVQNSNFAEIQTEPSSYLDTNFLLNETCRGSKPLCWSQFGSGFLHSEIGRLSDFQMSGDRTVPSASNTKPDGYSEIYCIAENMHDYTWSNVTSSHSNTSRHMLNWIIETVCQFKLINQH